MHKFARGMAATLLLASWPAGNGRIQGTVPDVTSAVIPAAQVEIVREKTGQNFSATANELGFYLFPSIPAGRYGMTVQFAGMTTWKGELLVETGQTAVVDASLTPGATTTEVTVVGDNPGTPEVEAGTGLVSLRTPANAPRQLRLTPRGIWQEAW